MNIRDQFLELYAQGLTVEALQKILVSPRICYDSLSSDDDLLFHIVNYVDAGVHKGYVEHLTTSRTLRTILRDDHIILLEQLKIEEVLARCFFANKDAIKKSDLPEYMKNFFHLFKDNVSENKEQIEILINAFPRNLQEILKSKTAVAESLEYIKKTRDSFWKFITENQGSYKQPWHAFTYDCVLEMTSPKSEGIPIVNFIPHKQIVKYLVEYQKREMIVLFESKASLFQMLQFQELKPLLSSRTILFYVLDEYPTKQLEVQNFRFAENKHLYPVNFDVSDPLINNQKILLKLLEEALKQPQDQNISDSLYYVGTEIFFQSESIKYGKKRCIAQKVENALLRWHDVHKTSLSKDTMLLWEPRDYFLELVESASLKRKIQAEKNPKTRLVHIVPQIVDEGHAPTKLLQNLCLYADLVSYDLYVIASERSANHPTSYPTASYVSESSLIRGSKTIALLQTRGISVAVAADSSTYEEGIAFIQQMCDEWKIDTAVFHGPDEMNTLASAASGSTLRVFFDHGTLPEYFCFDLYILSTLEAQNYLQKFLPLKTPALVLNYCMDARKDWDESPFRKTDMGLPEDCFAMTTISNHLDDRLTDQMCHAIGHILQRCPRAVYAPMGKFSKESIWRLIFATYGVNDRVFFLGNVRNPSQYARSMDLYLNEFPFGSGISILDAMAAGCPVVSMYQADGPQQGRYGATYFGLDRVVKSGLIDDYVDLACKLINDRAFYKEWSEHALLQYQKHSDLKEYVKSFENALRHEMDRK